MKLTAECTVCGKTEERTGLGSRTGTEFEGFYEVHLLPLYYGPPRFMGDYPHPPKTWGGVICCECAEKMGLKIKDEEGDDPR